MSRSRTSALVLASAIALTAGLASGLEITTASSNQTAQYTQDDPRTATLARLSKRIEGDFTDQSAQDVFEYISEITGADLLIMYESDIDPEGIDPEELVTLKIRNQPALTVLDRVIRNLNSSLAPSSEFAWQMTEDGAYQIGPKDALDRDTRTVIYDVGDLLFEVPNFDNAPDFDLQSSSGGQGGGQSPLASGGGGQDVTRLTAAERLTNLTNVITQIVEPTAWVSAGGTSSTITAYQSTLIVSAPDYVHRALGGYEFWPSSLQTTRYVDGHKETVIRPKPAKRTPARRGP